MDNYLIMDIVSRELNRHNDLLNHMESRLKKLPEGSLHIQYRDDVTYYNRILQKNRNRTSVAINTNTKDDERLIAELKERSNILHARPIIRNNIKCLERFKKDYKPYNPEELRYANDADSRLYLDGDICLNEWSNARYKRNPYKTENRIHSTKSGIYVRSKSEALIADVLSDYGIIFRNDCKEMFGILARYPDFHLIRTKDRRLFIWEHFGLLDNPDYVLKCFEKIDLYAEYGYHVGINLIITWETRDNPLTRNRVVEILEKNGFI